MQKQSTKYFGVIDIGSNAIRMAIAELSRNELTMRQRWRSYLMLGKEVFQQGYVPKTALYELEGILKIMLKEAENYPNLCLKIGATSALRDAENKKEVQTYLKQNLGISLEILSGQEEAEYLFEAVQSFMPLAEGCIAMGDLGGGSLEVSLLQENQLIYQESLNYGTLRILSSNHTQDRMSKNYKILQSLKQDLETLTGHHLWKSSSLLLTGGNAKTIASLIKHWSRRADKVSDAWVHIQWEEFISWIQVIESYSLEERIKYWNLSIQQAEVLDPAIAVFQIIGSVLKATEIFFPQISLKEARLLQLAKDNFPKLDIHLATDPISPVKIVDYNGNGKS